MQSPQIRKGLTAIALFWALALTLPLVAQAPGQPSRQRGPTREDPGQESGRGEFGGMQRVAGVVTSVSGDAIRVRTEDGTVYQITTTPNTRLMKSQGLSQGQPVPVKVAELKTGDGVMAAGNMDPLNKTLHAAFVVSTDAEQLKKLRENLGKTYISGKVTAIDVDNVKMTVLRPDGVSQSIGFDETTSFKRGGGRRRGGGLDAGGGTGFEAAPEDEGESITLSDIKVGDNVGGTGGLKAGVFIPAQLSVATPRRPRGSGNQNENPAAKPHS